MRSAPRTFRNTSRRRLLGASCALASIVGTAASPALANGIGALFVTSSTYAGQASTVAIGQALPNTNGAVAVADGSYPFVFANDAPDPNFGVTAPIALSAYLAVGSNGRGVQIGPLLDSLDVTGLTGVSTSFSSKSELSVNVSTDRTTLTLMGYVSPANMLDVSNSNTPGRVDPTNTDTQPAAYRAVVALSLRQGIRVTPVSAYSGNNGRAAILARDIKNTSNDAYLMVGNAGNGSGIEPVSVASSTGVQLVLPALGTPDTTPVGVQQGTPGDKNGFQFGFSVTSLGYAADKSGKDDNFRGETIFGSQLFVSKGSGGNGVNTVYQVTPGDDPSAPAAARITILPGMPTGLATNISATEPSTLFYPFGIWFANKTTLYVADEGVQSLASDPNTGLQKWVFNGTKWVLAYTLQSGLRLGVTYSIANYPAALAPATTGLRNISGNVDGKVVTIFATTATFSANADPGADPNQVVQIVDRLDATNLPASESFTTVQAPTYGKVYRGVAYAECDSLATCRAPFATARR